jgi:hypothetical protein
MRKLQAEKYSDTKILVLIAEAITKLQQNVLQKINQLYTSFLIISCVPQKTHSQQAMTKVKYVLVPDVK